MADTTEVTPGETLAELQSTSPEYRMYRNEYPFIIDFSYTDYKTCVLKTFFSLLSETKALSTERDVLWRTQPTPLEHRMYYK